MPQSLGRVIVHVVFSTKSRVRSLNTEIRGRLHAYMATVIRGLGCEAYRVGGTEDHVHLALLLARTVTVSELLERVKSTSSAWMKEQEHACHDFAWQSGYGAFSVSPQHLGDLVTYIDGQEEHHRTRTFQEEYRAFLAKYGVAYDERYVWD